MNACLRSPRSLRSLRWRAAAGALALAALAGSATSLRAEPGHEIEVFRGAERSVVRGTLHDDSLREERGVLATRGVAAGAPRGAPPPLAALGGPARERLQADLVAIARVYGEVLEVSAGPELKAELTALEPGEPLRVPHRHAPGGQDLAARTRHEASHAWVHALDPNAPAWLDEGLARYFESIERAAAGEIRVSASSRWRGALRSAGRAGKLPDLAQLERMPRDALSREPAAAASWALVFSLMQTRETRDVLRALLHREAPAGLAARLSALGADDPSALPRSWRRTASGEIADHLLIPAAPPEPELSADAVGDSYAEQKVHTEYRREVRCVRGVIAAGTPGARPVLLCTQRRITRPEYRRGLRCAPGALAAGRQSLFCKPRRVTHHTLAGNRVRVLDARARSGSLRRAVLVRPRR